MIIGGGRGGKFESIIYSNFSKVSDFKTFWLFSQGSTYKPETHFYKFLVIVQKNNNIELSVRY